MVTDDHNRRFAAPLTLFRPIIRKSRRSLTVVAGQCGVIFDIFSSNPDRTMTSPQLQMASSLSSASAAGSYSASTDPQGVRCTVCYENFSPTVPCSSAAATALVCSHLLHRVRGSPASGAKEYQVPPGSLSENHVPCPRLHAYT